MTLDAGDSARLIRETLDSVVAPAVRDALVSTALEESAYHEVPSSPDEFRSFVEGPLREALVKGLGEELADSIVEELGRMTDIAEYPSSAKMRRAQRVTPARSISPPPRRITPTHRASAPRRVSPNAQTLPAGIAPRADEDLPSSKNPRQSQGIDPTAATQPPPSQVRAIGRIGLTPPPYSGVPVSGPQSRPATGWGSDEYPAGAADAIGMPGAADSTRTGEKPYVLIATSDETLVRRLTPWLDKTAELVVLSSMRELVKDLEAIGSARIAILVDCRKPSIRPTAIAALSDELPPNVKVLLWGASLEQERGVLAVSPSVSRWIVLHADTRPKELAARCADIVG